MNFLEVLGPEVAAELRQSGAVRRFRKGGTLFHDGDRAEAVVVLLSGRVKVSYHDDQGAETILAISGPGDVLGEISMSDGGPRTASGVALDNVEALSIPAESFRKFLGDHPDAALALVRTVTDRLRDSTKKLVEFTRHDTLGRVAVRLVELADRYGEDDGEGGVRIGLPISQEELAGLTASSRESVVKALKVLRDRGVIETARRCVRVLDLDALRKYASA